MGLCRPKAYPRRALLPRQLAAGHHQHFFNFRLDLDVDGTGNSVVEMNTAALPAGPYNPYLGAFVMQETILHTEQEAQRQLNLASNRRWKVINPFVKNALGQLVGYMLVPGENGRLLRRANVCNASAGRFSQRPPVDHAI